MEKLETNHLQITQLFNAPIKLVWAVWSDPNHIKNWWGPLGFTNTIQQMQFHEGGEWKFTMHGPDGKNFPNRSIYKEIIPFKKIVFEHFNPHFITTVLFEERGEETFVNWSSLFDSSEMLEILIKEHKADEGLKQNVQKLEHYISDLLMNTNSEK